MAIDKKASAAWSGGMKEGKGSVSTESGALQAHPYGFKMRFEGVKGTNPEELIGAAHAACFTMALSKAIEDAGFTAERLETSATVSLDKAADGFAITAIALDLKGQVPGMDEAAFRKTAEEAKAACPLSKALASVPSITLTTTFG